MKKISTLAKVYITLAITAIIIIVAVTINTKSLLNGFWLTLSATGVFWAALVQDFGFPSLLDGTWLYNKKGGQ